jgi:Beta-xylosidase
MTWCLLVGSTVLAAAAAEPTASAQDGDVWLLAYFRQRYETRVEVDAQGRVHTVDLPEPMRVEQLHYALSEDGRNWQPLNGGRPVWGQRLRDPFLQREENGTWRLMGTGRAEGPRGEGPVCLTAASRDLVNWEDVRSLPLMAGVRDGQDRPAQNIWAPEWFFDSTTGDAVVVWSSSFEDAGWKKSRLWFSRTKDWKTFTPAKVLFEPPYSVIDGTLLKHDGTYYLFHKEEEFGERTGERRAIRVATAEQLEGPYRIHEGPLNNGQIVPTITEGPSVMPDPVKPGWLLLYDYCMTNRFGASSSPDLINWSVEENVTFPADARHGSVVRISGAEAERLRKAFGSGE